MDYWHGRRYRPRYLFQWPYLTSLYSGGVNERNGERSYRSTSTRSGRRKKYEDPVLAYETVFDPMNTYGSYNIRMSHPEDLSIGADPTIWHRQAYKQEDSSSYNTQERRGIDKETCRVVMCVLLVLSFIGVVVAATVLAVILSQSGSRPKSLQTILQGNITIVNRNFTDPLYDSTSEEYKVLVNEFCDALSSMYQDSNDADFKYYYQNCTVKGFAPGSIIVTFLLYVRGIPVIVDLNNFMTREIIRNNNKGFGIGSLIMMNATPLIANDGSSILITRTVKSTPLDISSSSSSQPVALNTFSTQDTVLEEPDSTFQVPDGGSIVVPMTSQYLDQTSAVSIDEVSPRSVHTSVLSTIQPSSPVVSPADISSKMSSSHMSTTKSFHDVSIMPSSVQQSKIQSGVFMSPISTQLEPSVVPSDVMSDLSTDKDITASLESVSISRLFSEKGSSKSITKVSMTMTSDQYMLASSQIEPPVVVSSQITSDSSPVVDSITTSVDELLKTQLSAGQTTSKTANEALLTKTSDQYMVASSELGPSVVVSSQIVSDSSSVVDSITTSVDELLKTQLSEGQTTPKTASENLITVASDQYMPASSEFDPPVVVSSPVVDSITTSVDELLKTQLPVGQTSSTTSSEALLTKTSDQYIPASSEFDPPLVSSPVVDSITTSVDELLKTQLSVGQTSSTTSSEALLTKTSDQYMPASSEFDPPLVSSPDFDSITTSVDELLKTQLPVEQTSSTTASETLMTMASDQFMISSSEFDPSVVVSSHIISESSLVVDSVTTSVNELLLTQMSYAQTNMTTESEALMTMISDQYTIASSEIDFSVVVSSQLISDLSPVVDSISTSFKELLKTQMSVGQTSSKIANEASVTMTPDQYMVASSHLEPSVVVSSQFISDTLSIADSFITSINRISTLPLSFGLSSSKLVNVISKTATLGGNAFASSELDPSVVVLSDLISDSSSVAESNTISLEGLSSLFVEQTRSLAVNEVSMAATPHRSTVTFSEFDPSIFIPLEKTPDLSSVADSITASFDEVSITPLSVDKTSVKAVNELSVTPTLDRSIVASSGFDPSGVVSSAVISDLPSVADSPNTSAGVKSITNVTQVSFSSVNKISMSQTFGEFIVASSEFEPNVIVSSEHISQFSSIAESITASNIKAPMTLVSIEQPISKVISEVSMTPTLHRSIDAYSELDPIVVFSSDVISNLSSAADHVATSFDGISVTPLTFEQNGSTAINEISTTPILVRPTVASSTQDLTVVVSSEDSTDSSFNTDSFASTLQETLITPLSVEQSNEVGKSIVVSSEFEPSNIVSLKDTSGILSSDDYIASSFDGVSMLAFSVEQTSSNSFNDILVKQTLDQYTIASSKLFLSSEIISDSYSITDSTVALPRVLSTTPSAVEQSSFIAVNEISVTPTFGEFVAVSSESDPSVVISSKNITDFSSVADSSAISSGYISEMSSSHVLVDSSALTPVSVQAAPSSFQLSDVSSANILLTSPSLKHSSTLPVVASIIQPSVQVDAFSSLIHPSDVVSSVKASLDILSIDGSFITPSQHVLITPSSVEHSNSVSVGNVSMSAFFSENIYISSKLQPSIAVSMEDSITSFTPATSLAVGQSISWPLEDVSISPTFTDVPTKLPDISSLENTSALSSVYGSSMISVTTPPVVNLLTVQGNMTIDRNFTNELENSSSDAYNDLAAEFCESIYSIFKGNDSIDLQNCEVIGFAPGSIIVTYVLKVAGTQYVVDISNIVKTGIVNNNRTGFGSGLLVLSNPSPLGISPISTTGIVQPTMTVHMPTSSFQIVVEDALSKFPSGFRESSSVFSAVGASSTYASVTPSFEDSTSISVYKDTSTTLDGSTVISPRLKPTVAISSEDTSDLSSIVDSITTSFGTVSMKSSSLLLVEDASNDPLTFSPMLQASALPSSFPVFSMDPTMTTTFSDQLSAVAVSISPSSIQESTFFSTPQPMLVNSTGDTTLYVSSVDRSITTSFTSPSIEQPSSAFIEKGSISTTTLELSADFDLSKSNYSVVVSSTDISSMLSANSSIITSFKGTPTTQSHLEQSASAEDMAISPTLVEISATSVGYSSLRNTSYLASVEDSSMTLVTTSPFDNQLTVRGNITINRNFTDDLENSSSAAYIELAAEFCEAMFSIFQGNDSIELRNCAVIGFAPEMTIVTYELDITGTQSITDIKNILDTRTANYSGTTFGNSSLVLSSPSALVNIGNARSSVTTSSFVSSTNMDPVLSSSFREVTENAFSQSATVFTDPSSSFAMFSNRSADVSIMPSSVDQLNSTGDVLMIQTSSNIAVVSSELKPTVVASLGETIFSSVAESIVTSFKEVSIPSSSIQVFVNDTSYIYSSTSLSSLYQSDSSLASSAVDQSRALSADGTSISHTEVGTIIISSETEASATPSSNVTSQLIIDKSISTSFEDIPTLQATMNQSSAIFEDVSPSQIVDEMTLFSSLVKPSFVISSEITSKDTSRIDEFIMTSSEYISVSTSIVDETIVPSSAEQSMYSVQSMSTPVS